MLINFLFLLLSISPFSTLIFGQRQQEWESANYPNPTAGDWQKCNMPSKGLLCDPDAILSESERNGLNDELGQFEANTRQENGRDDCERKGITAAVALAKRVRGGNKEAVRAMANEMLRSWDIDARCQKGIMLVMSAEDRALWIARMPRVPVSGSEMNDFFKAEKEHFRAKQYYEAIQNILHSIRDRAISSRQHPRR